MPDQVFVAVDWEVTVTVTTHTCAIGVPVMEKSLEACEVVVEVTKKVVALPSGAAETEILTPLEGMAEVILTFNGKFGPGAGADVLPMAGVVVTIAQKAGENDQLFGSVTVKDVADALERKNFTIDRRKIQLDEPIKQLGEHKIAVRLHRDVTVEITVNVVRDA